MTSYRTRTVAGALTVLLGAFGVTAGLASTAQAALVEVAGGHLDWGLKQSFRNYIAGPIAHGTITTSEGATRNADGTFRFPEASGEVDADADTASLEFAGKVEFSGHDSGSGPQLFLTITDIRVTLGGLSGSGSLVADVVSKSLSSGDLVTYDDVDFADLTAGDLVAGAGDSVSVSGVGATLTEAGVPAFANFYPAGTALDPLSVSVTTVPPPVWEPAVQASKTTGLDPAGETITVTGNGFDPAANIGTRPPLPGQRTGVFVVFAKITQPWRPSEGAPSSARTVLDQKWALPAASRAIVDPGGTNPDFTELTEEGTFSTTLDVAAVTEGSADCAVDTCGVIVYAAGGAVNAAHEFFLPLTFATTETTEPTTPAPPDGEVADARLEWGFKESFRNYIRGSIAHGSWTLSGVTDNGGAEPFRWADLGSGTFDPNGPNGLLTFAGSVRFTGHDSGSGPLLDLSISQPQVRIVNGAATLLLDVRSKGLENPNEFVELDDAEFATLDLAAGTSSTVDGVTSYAGVPAVLTEAGAQGFAGFYPAGTQLDPVTFAIAADGATLPPPTSTASPAAQGGVTPAALASTGSPAWPLALAGAMLVVFGTGLLLFRRRPRGEHL